MTVFGKNLAIILGKYIKYALHSEAMSKEDRRNTVVFQSKNRKELDNLRPVIDWIKSKILIPEYGYPPETHFTATCFQTMYATLGESHLDSFVRENASKAMNHSQRTTERHYDKDRSERAVSTLSAIRNHFGLVPNDDADEMEDEDEAQPGPSVPIRANKNKSLSDDQRNTCLRALAPDTRKLLDEARASSPDFARVYNAILKRRDNDHKKTQNSILKSLKSYFKTQAKKSAS